MFSGISWSQLSTVIAAVGALGTAAFGLVDAFKALPGGGISRAGFKFINDSIKTLAPDVDSLKGTGLSLDKLLFTLRSQWINGATATSDQVNIAKSLIKLRLTPETAPALAMATGVDAATLATIAAKIKSGTALTQPESDVFGRFDVLLSTMLDQAYQRASQRYRNVAKATAVPVAVALAVTASLSMPGHISTPGAVLLGLIATPIAPVAKDITSALATASQTIQSWKR